LSGLPKAVSSRPASPSRTVFPLVLTKINGDELKLESLKGLVLEEAFLADLTLDSQKALFWALCYYGSASNLEALAGAGPIKDKFDKETLKEGFFEAIKADSVACFQVLLKYFQALFYECNFYAFIESENAERLLQFISGYFRWS
ncbi:MAG: hypothetical protein WC371_04615, partial [Parachlamydiales bacterium]